MDEWNSEIRINLRFARKRKKERKRDHKINEDYEDDDFVDYNGKNIK